MRMEIGEAPPAADEASQFRGSGTIGTPNGRGNRNAATVTAAKNGSRLFAAVRGGKVCGACFAPQGRGVRGAGLVDF